MNRAFALVMIGLLALAGCPPKTTDPAQSQQLCRDAAMVTVKIVGNPDTDPDTLGNHRAVIANRCVEDQWSELAIECTRNVANADALRACWYKHLSQEQQDKVTKAASSMGGGGTGLGNTVTSTSGALGVTGVEPTHGAAAGNQMVAIKGSRFLADGPRKIQVFLGGREASVIRVADDSTIQVQTPPGKPGDVVDLRVVFDPGGEISVAKAFTYE